MNAKKSLIIAAILIGSFFLAAAQVDLGIAVRTPLPPPPVAVVDTPVVASPGPGYIWVPAHWDWDKRLHRVHWR
jgi:hypothetical protein